MGSFCLLYRVKYIFLILFVFCLCSFSPAQAQNEDWDTYMAKFGDKPGSILVDMGLVSVAPDKRYPYLLITGPHSENCNNKDGLPDKEDIEQLENILDATDNFITGVTAKVLAGTFTYNCERVNYYYLKDTMGVRRAIMRLYNRSYPFYKYTISIKKDPEWRAYRTFLYPDEKMKNWMDNDKIISGMLQRGDSLSQKRDIHFDLYFRSDTDRNSFIKFAKAKGYKADELLISQSKTAPYELIISKFDAVKMDLIVAMTEEIKQEMKKYKGFYNGWEAPLKKQMVNNKPGISK